MHGTMKPAETRLVSLFLVTRRSLRSTLFPYTTLFRSWYSASKVSASPSPLSVSSPEPPTRTSSRPPPSRRSEEHTSELQSHSDLVCRLLLEKKKPLPVALADQK